MERGGGGRKIPKKNIPFAVIVSICSARTDCGILLPCWSAVYFSSIPLLFSLCFSPFPHYCNMAPSISLSVWAALLQHRPRYVLPSPLATSLVKVYDHPSWIKHYTTRIWPQVPASAGNRGDKHRKNACETGHLLSK